MHIIEDSKEQKPLFQDRDKYSAHTFERRKLDEGDYSTPELEDKLVIERKAPGDLVSTLAIHKNHERFNREIQRAKDKGKKFYILVECSREDLLTKSYPGAHHSKVKMKPFDKMMNTMTERYKITFIFCNGRANMEFKILELFETELKLLN